MARVFLSVGSNLGDRAALLRQAVERLRSLPEVEFVDASPVYWTEPWERRPGESSQNRETWFFNCVVAIETTLEPPSLLERLAGRLATMLLAEFPCAEVRVRVRKLTPPMEGLQGIPGVELTRRR